MVLNIVMRRFEEHGALTVVLLCVVGVAIRVAYRGYMGSEDFWQNSYSVYYHDARNIIAGRGLLLAGYGPAYPYFLALTALAGEHYMFVVVPQALFGAVTIACAFLVGKELFGERIGLLSAFLTAFYPYYVGHDTALQETSMVTASSIASVYLLLRAKRDQSTGQWLAAGAMLGVTVMIRFTTLPFALAALAWIALFGEGLFRQKLLRASVVLLAFLVAIGAWPERNFLRGSGMSTTGVGYYFWIANNPQTFSHYPTESIDLSTAEAKRALTPSERREAYDRIKNDWFLNSGLDYVRNHPSETFLGATRKVVAGFSFNLNPAKTPLIGTIYFLSYSPILILGLIGMVLAWSGWREHSLIYFQFLAFIAVSAVFWAHTSHRTHLDVYLIIFSAFAIDRFLGHWPKPFS